ncbi:MAG: Hsp33 family molecular chaperone HslO [Oligoflexia bacterium]|nr:Hsp33 family molecular chaperone HslO [Oligoflexia bacterium]MBF0365289.1 Hsp33 family molecular chaperone HslO [Oligoflexia bacterium]
MLNSSTLITLIDDQEDYLIHFLEGQKIIQEMVLTQSLQASGLNFYRDLILTTMLMTSLLKRGERLGIYIDSHYPDFHFKIETDFDGRYRSVLLPEDFKEFPQKLCGRLRLTKSFPGKRPYQSIIEINDSTIDQLMILVLIKSYQIDAHLFTSKESDQALLLMRLPPSSKKAASKLTPKEYWFSRQKLFSELFQLGLNELAAIQAFVETHGLKFLHAKALTFTCGCSIENMQALINALSESERQNLYQGSKELEVVCEYCKKKYQLLQK